MILRKSSDTEHPVFTEGVNTFVPASWKLWPLVFKGIASGHYDEMNSDLEVGTVPMVDNISFQSSIEQLYFESCCDVRAELPSGFREISGEDRHDVVNALRIVAQDIIDSFSEAKIKLAADCGEMKVFEKVVSNCRIVLSITDEDWDVSDFEYAEKYRYFNSVYVESWHQKVNGVLIEDISYNTFRHVLDCDDYFDVHNYETNSLEREDYSSDKITPLAGFGMAMYAFILVLMNHRYADDEPFISDDEIHYPEPWEFFFESRIDWKKNGYNLEEDSWKMAYLSLGADPPKCDVEQESLDLLFWFCGRSVFREVFSSDNFNDIITSKGPFVVGYDYYHYIHNLQRNELERIYALLRKETDYLYDNIHRIAGCFENWYHADSIQKHSKWRFEEKIKNNTHINFLYSSLDSIHPKTIQRLLYERSGLAYEHLDNQPIIYSEIVENYIKDCIVHNEKLKLELIRALSECSIRNVGYAPSIRSLDGNQSILKACQKLQEARIIDENNNILPKKEGGTYYKTTELTNFLVRNEIVVPSCGWSAFVSDSEDNNSVKWALLSGPEKKECLDEEQHLNEEYYKYYLRKHLKAITKQLDWTEFSELFLLQGEKLKSDRLHYFFTSNNDERARIITNLLRKYDKPAKDVALVTIRKNKIDED